MVSDTVLSLKLGDCSIPREATGVVSCQPSVFFQGKYESHLLHNASHIFAVQVYYISYREKNHYELQELQAYVLCFQCL
jgi:hypothetical protein